MEKGTHKPCIQANVILDEEAKLNTEELTSISLTMLSGGLDVSIILFLNLRHADWVLVQTVTTLLQWSVALLAQRPDIQQKAWKAIEEFYSVDQPLCDALDDQKCSYVVALVRECLRYVLLFHIDPRKKKLTGLLAKILYRPSTGSPTSLDQGRNIRGSRHPERNSLLPECLEL
jgi:3-hydroxyphenylacetate 6-hydroxylase